MINFFQIYNSAANPFGQRQRVALVGPSGCGKSTLAGILAGYEIPESGEVLWEGRPLERRGYCPVQMIGQHPEQAVNPRWRMEKILRECWNPKEELLQRMGIEKSWMTRWPNELSGGELQRFCIARVLGPETKFLVCDEISTMLDVITQAQIWQILLEETPEFRPAYSFRSRRAPPEPPAPRLPLQGSRLLTPRERFSGTGN